MRISDWSSDVCSSDLVAIIAADQPVHPAGLALVMDFLGKALDAAVGLLQQNLIGRAAPVGQRLAPEVVEIGRAACREGVCPYVLNSVVAVALKKKTNTNS